MEKYIVNIVDPPSIMYGQLSVASANSPGLCFCLSHYPARNFAVDLYVISDHVLEYVFKRNSMGLLNIPVIAFGDKDYLNYAFTQGCVDFMKDPWCTEELEYRILKVRKEISFVSGVQDPPSITSTERKLLRIFRRYPGQTITRSFLMEAVWGHVDEKSRSLDMHISSLNKKFRKTDMTGNRIYSDYGAGYTMIV